MKFKKLTTLLIFLITTGMVFSGPLHQEYEKTKKEIKEKKDTPEMRKAQLETTLLINLQRTLNRYFRYSDYKKIKTTDFKYEKADYIAISKENREYIYYIKYKSFIGKFIFPVNPETNLTYPSQEKILKKK